MNARTGLTIALFPEASFGAALNCVGIAQALRDRGARPVFVCHPGFTGLFAEYGFPEHHLPAPTGNGRPDTWQEFVGRHMPHFGLAPLEQLDTYVGPTWNTIVDTAVDAEAPLRQLLARLKPDAVVLDNVVMFPALGTSGIPWARVVSCAETELPDPNVPPYLSGMAADDPDRARFEKHYLRAIAPAHDRFNRFRAAAGMQPLPSGLFLEASPWLNLLLTPRIVRRERALPLDADRFIYLEGCVRSERPFEPPEFPRGDGPLVYLGFGSLGASDTALIERMIKAFADFPARFIVNVGGFREAYRAVPDNVYLDGWLPQPSVVAQCDLFIHHGGNNSFCEALRFGVPSLVMPYCWDGHDNAQRAVEAGVGLRLDRSSWHADELTAKMRTLLADTAMGERLAANAAMMAETPGTACAADAILAMVTERIPSARLP